MLFVSDQRHLLSIIEVDGGFVPWPEERRVAARLLVRARTWRDGGIIGLRSRKSREG